MRGKQAKPRTLLPDAKYNSLLVAKFANKMMVDGKKELSRSILYKAIDFLAKKSKMGGAEAFEQALQNIEPKVEVRSRRVGGANYQVPVPVTEKRQEALAIKWIVSAARDSRKKTSFAESLGQVLFDSFNKEGVAYKKKEDTHRMADANKAFAQFAW